MKAGVIIVTYNGVRWIENCLKSVLLSGAEYEVLVVDNASKDGTVELIRKKFKEVKIVQLEENIGFGRANNKGLTIALKELWDYVFLLNQDTEVFPETFQKLINVSKRNKEYGIISPIHLNGSATGLEPTFLYYLKKPWSDKLTADFLLTKAKKDIYTFGMINAAAWLLPRQTLEVVGGFNPMFFLYGEDDNYCQRVLYHGLKIGLAPSAFIIHDSDNNNLKELVKGSKRYYQNFLNIIKIKYANVNTDDFKNLRSLETLMLKQAFKSLLRFNLEDFRVSIRKRKIIKSLDFSEDIKIDRERKPNYLSIY